MKNETDVLALINKIQTQLFALDQKINTLINRSTPEAKISPTSSVGSSHASVKSNDHHKERVMYAAICADCKKECKIPFKPSTDRPVYCQDCFSRRKVISLSGIKVDNKFPETPSLQPPSNKAIDNQKPQAKKKKKSVTVKKPIAKKKSAPKKK
jgi:CxxC-x17-CxxC domain-containing protein